MSTIARQGHVRVGALPGVRTLRSPRFRLVAAIMLAGIGLAANAAFLVAVSSQWQEDFEAYYVAAARMVDGESPYTQAQLDHPVDAACPGCYLYPPVLAQALSPMTVLPFEAARFLWFGLTWFAAFAAAWIGTGIRGARPTLERAVWCVVAVAFFYPTFQDTWLGNTSSLVALSMALVALGGVVAGMAAALTALLKVAPGAFVPLALVADSRSRSALILTLGAVGLVSVALAPQAWLDFPIVFRNLLAGSNDVTFNMAPAQQVAEFGASETLVAAVRAAALAAGGASLLLGIWLARRPAGLPAAAALASAAMLLIPGTLWYHYLAVLLPIAAMAWVAGDVRVRCLLLATMFAVNVGGMTELPVGIAAAMLTIVVAVWTLWPSATAVETGPERSFVPAR